ncbi:uncharacterized protein [Lolium perenne]|uniref:uncharacterized protein n=1 Tax=Lolium perenne TaxID=4522 RepID=UPI0021F69137|nr:uncharacterized protein LOC127327769 [Lolium perenne]
MSAMAATGAALRLRLLFRMLRAGELLALLALLSWTSSRAPSAAAAAAVRVAGSLLFSPRFVFVLGNAIVLLLLVLSKRERDPSPASSSHSVTGTSTAGVAVEVEQIPAASATASFPLYVAPTMPTPESEAPAAMEATWVPEVLPCREMATVFEEEIKPAAAAVPTARAVVSKARAPRRSRSEKMSGSRRAASPEQQLMMRRSELDNGRRRWSSASARDVAAGWAPGTEDAEEFQRKVEAFIARRGMMG